MQYKKQYNVLKYSSLLSIYVSLVFLFSCSRSVEITPDFVVRTKAITKLFEERLLNSADELVYKLPHVAFSDVVTANAIWKNDTIYVGESFFTQAFLSDEDRVSILYHEYNHSVNERERRYPCQEDLSGTIVQVETDILFEKEQSPYEIELDYAALLDPSMTDDERKLLYETVSSPCLMRFVYAPSNLSRDELHCYRAEQRANNKLFVHSNAYADFLEYRIKREEEYLKMRIQFELRNALRVDGSAR